jgi:hypothetical protein
MANKKGPLGKAEMFYIEEKFKSGQPIEEICIDLNRPQFIVDKYIAKNKLQKVEKTGMEAGEHFIKYKGSTIMTENASTLGDAQKKTHVRKSASCVTKIRPE